MNPTPHCPTPPVPTPLPLRHYSATLANVARWLLRDATFGLQVLTGDAALTTGALARIVLGSSQGEARLRVDLSAAPALAAIVRDPDPLRARLLFNLYLDVHLAALRRAGMPGLVVRDCAWDDTPLADGALPIATRDGEIPGVIESVDEGFAAALAGIAPGEKPLSRDVSRAIAALRLPCRLCLSRQRISVSLLASLRPGDVLFGWHEPLTTAPSGDTAVTVWLPDSCATSASGWTARATRLGSALTFTSPFAMTTDFNADLPESTFDGLVVPLHLDIGTLDLPLADIARMQPGYLLELPAAAVNAQVRLTVHGRTVGHGELIAIGEHLGVQITHMEAVHEHQS